MNFYNICSFCKQSENIVKLSTFNEFRTNHTVLPGKHSNFTKYDIKMSENLCFYWIS